MPLLIAGTRFDREKERRLKATTQLRKIPYAQSLKHNSELFFSRALVILTPSAWIERAAMRDLRRDWIKWSKAERISALLIIGVLTVAIPSLMVSNVATVATAHGLSHTWRSS